MNQLATEVAEKVGESFLQLILNGKREGFHDGNSTVFSPTYSTLAPDNGEEYTELLYNSLY
jgi:hypothetical protein